MADLPVGIACAMINWPSLSEMAVYVTATKYLVALWAVISSTEWIAARRVFADSGLLCWNIMRLRRGRFYQTKFAAHIFSARAVDLVLAFRLFSAVLLFFLESAAHVVAASSLLFCAGVYISGRASVGGDGSDQMGLLLTLGLVLMAVAQLIEDAGVMFGAVLLIGGQGVLAYLVSGASKLISPAWRSGLAIVGVMNTRAYGHDFAVSLVSRYRTAAIAMCWLIIVTEVFFPVVLFLPSSILYGALSAAALFHISNAYFMGLNTFVPTFLGTYPSLLVLNSVVRESLLL